FHTGSGHGDWLVKSDAMRLEQIIVNLLNNALAAMKGNGTIDVRLTARSHGFSVAVTDSGYGISPADQRSIFEPYFRGEVKQNQARGLGLGLPFSQMIAHSLGGHLELTDSRPGQTTFTLSIGK